MIFKLYIFQNLSFTGCDVRDLNVFNSLSISISEHLRIISFFSYGKLVANAYYIHKNEIESLSDVQSFTWNRFQALHIIGELTDMIRSPRKLHTMPSLKKKKKTFLNLYHSYQVSISSTFHLGISTISIWIWTMLAELMEMTHSIKF